MSKRRRGTHRTHYQVPSLQSLTLRIIRERNKGVLTSNLRRTNSQQANILRNIRMDSDMNSSRSSTSSKRARTDTSDGAQEAGQGLDVTIPRAVPHCYNNNYTVRLTYADNYRHTVNYGASARQVFRANSIFDPDFTGVGHQPFFRDMWASQYDFYTVLACDYEIHLYNGCVQTLTTTATGTNANRYGSVQVSFLPSTESSDYVTSTTVYPIAEMKNVTTRFLVPEDVTVFTGTVTPGDFVVDAKDMDSDNTWVAVGSNPNVPRFIGYVITSAQWAAMSGQDRTPFIDIQAYVKLNYTVQFTQINPSLRQVPS